MQLYIAGTFRQRKISSKATVKQFKCDRQASGIYFRQTPVGSRLLCSRSIVALLIVVYFYIHGRTFLNPNFRFVKKLVRNLIESKSCFDESDEINIQTKISFNKVHDEEEDEDDDDETIKKKGLKEPGL